MKTTLILQEDLVKRAMDLTHIKKKTELVHEGLKALIAQASRERLIVLGGSEKNIPSIPRRRSNKN